MIYKFTQKDLSELALASLEIEEPLKFMASWGIYMNKADNEVITLELVELVLPESE